MTEAQSLNTDLTANQFAVFSDFLKAHSGINLVFNEKNTSLLLGRLQKMQKKVGSFDIATAVAMIERSDTNFCRQFILAMTTNTTHFFREDSHFPTLASELRRYLAKNPKSMHDPLRIWCAAASTGQEPYSIAMAVTESLPDLAWKMLATDIDRRVIRQAMAGIYSEREMRSVPKAMRLKYFESKAESSVVRENLKAHIKYALFNLIQPQYPFEHKFDVVFCRNVFIYFDNATIDGILSKMCKAMAPGSILFVGHSEAMMQPKFGLKRIAPAVYRLAK